MKTYIFGVVGVLALLTIFAFGAKAQTMTPVEPVTQERFVIKDDNGGQLNSYVKAFGVLKEAKVPVKIDGMCASACTLVTSTDFNLDYCVTKNAELGIHHPFAMDSSGDLVYTVPAIAGAESVWSEVFYKKYPKWLQEFIDKAGGAPSVYKGAKPSDMLDVPFSEISKHVGVCN